MERCFCTPNELWQGWFTSAHPRLWSSYRTLHPHNAGVLKGTFKQTAKKTTCFKRKGPIPLTWDLLQPMEKRLLASLGFALYISSWLDISVVAPSSCWFSKKETIVTGPSEKMGESGAPATKLYIYRGRS